MIGMSGVQRGRNVGVSAGADHCEQPAAKLGWILEVFQDFLANQEVGRLVVAKLDIAALDGIARLRLPQAWTVCGGPAYVRAARSLIQQLQNH